MTENQFYIAELLFRAFKGELTQKEEEDLNNWLAASPENRDLQQQLEDIEWIRKEWKPFVNINVDVAWQGMEERLAAKKNTYPDQEPTGTGRTGVTNRTKGVRIMRITVFGAAAAAALVFFLVKHFADRPPAEIKEVVIRQPLAPAKQGATLHLAGGPEVELAGLAIGFFEKVGCLDLKKTDSDRIVLSSVPDCALPAQTTADNSLSTPRGKWFRLVLTDGTSVRLKPASILQFPTEFIGAQRDVRLEEGEGYFDVAPAAGKKDRPKIFMVHVPTHHKGGTGMLNITSTGTRFSVRAYPGETDIRTSLDEGAINVEKDGIVLALHPGEVAILDANGELRRGIRPASDTTAWNEGLFSFKEQPIDGILQELGRWYDATIIYKGEKPTGVCSIGGFRQDSIGYFLQELKKLGALHQYSIHTDTVFISR